MKLEQLRAQLKQSALEHQQQEKPKPSREQSRERRNRKRQGAKRGGTGIVRHKVFVPVLTGWGAALGGLSVAMLPGAAVASILMTTGLAALGALGRPVLAVLAAALCGLAAFLIARALQRSRAAGSRDHILADIAARRIHPIDPASELGSESLDAPLAPAADQGLEASLAAAAAAVEEDGEDPSPNWAAHWAPEEPFELGADQALDAEHGVLAPEPSALAEDEPLPEGANDTFAAPARDKVWVIGSEAEVAPAPETAAALQQPEFDEATPLPPPPANGIERLRQARPEDLSLVELVERFAAALHDHQQAARRRAAADHARFGSAELAAPARDAALAEALKALSQFTQGDGAGERAGDLPAGQSISRVGDTERALRNALARLQDMRGAA